MMGERLAPMTGKGGGSACVSGECVRAFFA